MLATVNGLSYEVCGVWSGLRSCVSTCVLTDMLACAAQTSLSKENAARSKPSGGHRRYPCNRSQSLEVYHQQKRSGSDMHGDADPFGMEPPSKRMRQQTTDDVDGINAPSKYLEPPKLGNRSRRQPEHAEQRSAKRHRSAACALAHVQEQQLPCDIDFRDPTDLTDHEKEMLAFLQCSEDLDEEFLESTSEQPIDLLLNNPSSELRHEVGRTHAHARTHARTILRGTRPRSTLPYSSTAVHVHCRALLPLCLWCCPSSLWSRRTT